MAQSFFLNSLYPQKFVLIHLTMYHWQPCILQFCDITKNLLQINTSSQGLLAPVAVAKFLDLVIGNSVFTATSW